MDQYEAASQSQALIMARVYLKVGANGNLKRKEKCLKLIKETKSHLEASVVDLKTIKDAMKGMQKLDDSRNLSQNKARSNTKEFKAIYKKCRKAMKHGTLTKDVVQLRFSQSIPD